MDRLQPESVKRKPSVDNLFLLISFILFALIQATANESDWIFTIPIGAIIYLIIAKSFAWRTAPGFMLALLFGSFLGFYLFLSSTDGFNGPCWQAYGVSSCEGTESISTFGSALALVALILSLISNIWLQSSKRLNKVVLAILGIVSLAAILLFANYA